MIKTEKCPYCGNLTLGKIANNNPDSKHVLMEINTNQSPQTLTPINALLVDAYGCVTCKGLVLRCDSIWVEK